MHALAPRIDIGWKENEPSNSNVTLSSDRLPESSSSQQNRRRHPRKADEEWERIKGVVETLYGDEDLPLKEVSERLQKEHDFTATENQLKYKIKKWKLGKNVKTREMQHIIRIQNKRLNENGSKRTSFRIRNKSIADAKIQRFRREHQVVKRSMSRTPSVLSWRSPSPTISTLGDDEWMRFVRWSPALSPDTISCSNQKSTDADIPDFTLSSKPKYRPELDLASHEVSWVWQLDSTVEETMYQDFDNSSIELYLGRETAEPSSLSLASPSLEAFGWWRIYDSPSRDYPERNLRRGNVQPSQVS